jgi:hypothetical protein
MKSKVPGKETFVWCTSYSEWYEWRECFIATHFYFCMVFDIRKAVKSQVGMKLIGTHQRLIQANQVVGLQVKGEKTDFVFMCLVC